MHSERGVSPDIQPHLHARVEPEHEAQHRLQWASPHGPAPETWRTGGASACRNLCQSLEWVPPHSETSIPGKFAKVDRSIGGDDAQPNCPSFVPAWTATGEKPRLQRPRKLPPGFQSAWIRNYVADHFLRCILDHRYAWAQYDLERPSTQVEEPASAYMRLIFHGMQFLFRWLHLAFTTPSIGDPFSSRVTQLVLGTGD